MSLRVLKFLGRETAGSRLRILSTSFVSGLSRGLLLATFNTAAAAGASGLIDPLLLAGFLAALLVYLVTSYDSSVRADRVIAAMIQRLRLRLCDKLLFAQLRFLESRSTGEIYAQISQDITRLASAAITFLSTVHSSVLLVFALAYLGWLSLPGLLAALAAVVAGAAAYYWQDREMTEKVERASRKEAAFYDAVSDLLRGFKELKLSRARHTDLSTHLRETTREHGDLAVEIQRMYHVSALTSQGFTFLLVGVLVFLLPAVFPSGASTIFQFLATILYIIGPLESVVSAIPAISRARIALDNVERLEASLDSGMEENRDPQVAPLRFRTIGLHEVHYRFIGKSPEEEFEVGPVDLELQRGEVLFIIGGNGAGKTTLLKLLTGLYRPDDGRVLLDGREIGTAEFQAYREMFAAVFSDFHLFRRLYGVKNPDLALLDELLTLLQIRHKTRLVDGEFTTINLSAGQRKRLSYAVDRLSDRQIYVFDEFAADQDPSFRRFFYRELVPELKRRGKTVIAVTHDERWFDAADRVVKMEYGRIIEVGSGADLAASIRSIAELPESAPL